MSYFLPATMIEQGITRALVGWDAGICLYLVLAANMMISSTREKIRYRAQQLDESQLVILILVIIGAVASLTAIIVELAVAKSAQGNLRYAYIGLALFTIVASWAFTHMMFALHYAHDYYIARIDNASGGLQFPNEENPTYGDFLYFAYVIGTSAQTADVSFTSKPMRRVGLLHCVLAFLFNTTILALTINIAASLF
ncbi:MAG TPA: DUF1345 domain-containing protein [Spongiibacteraceae bacterium]|nr:DUF1345 domain-containing protein [Spongiibacteraceae bacterium]